VEGIVRGGGRDSEREKETDLPFVFLKERERENKRLTFYVFKE
jgi:hypothetical protein